MLTGSVITAFLSRAFFAEWKKARFDKRNVTEFQPLAVKGANFIKV
jgi:hypothetical protein